MAQLIVQEKDGRSYTFPIEKDRTAIGRGKDNDVVIADNSVSRHHALLAKTDKGYLLTDLSSFNGTKVAGRKIQSTLLQDADEIIVGFSKIIFNHSSDAVRTPTQSFVLESEDSMLQQEQQVIESRSEQHTPGSDNLLVSQKGGENEDGEPSAVSIETQNRLLLERTNKVLFVLYEISRQLNTISNFNELMNRIMDLLFMVIKADFGFVVLTGKTQPQELVPVVVKHREESAKSTREIKASRTIIDRVIKDKVALLTTNAMDDSRLDHGKSLFLHQIRSAMCVPLWKKEEIIGVIQLDSVSIENQFTNDDLELLKAIGSQMSLVIEQASLNEQIREEEMLRSRLERFHSPQVIDLIIRGGQETQDNLMEPQELTSTILFADIVGFTQLSEEIPPRDINLMLNRYFSRMTDIIFEHQGTLDKYIGDGLMAVFGAPIEKPDDAQRAVLTALGMRDEVVLLRDELGVKDFNIRIGLNTGRVLAGNIGSTKRMDYSVIGDAVNIAARLETIAPPGHIYLGLKTYRLVKERFSVKTVGPRKIRGRTADIMVYEVTGIKD